MPRTSNALSTLGSEVTLLRSSIAWAAADALVKHGADGEVPAKAVGERVDESPKGVVGLEEDGKGAP